MPTQSRGHGTPGLPTRHRSRDGALAMGLSACRVVLVRPHYPGNVGASARVMGNFGLDDLVLVAPVADPLDPQARQLSTHSEAILHRARVVAELADALADCHVAVATSALHGGLFRRQNVGTPGQV